ncbi:MAG: M6 family metalloprotease domain-containing protein [Paludibacteraceae bacterium]|nr:M6 family metalloprotease domain-containing protein [Paludibacteraceae bacterium]
MQQKTYIVGLVGLFIAVTAMWAVPARRDGRTVMQANGTAITIYQQGDEWCHWLTNDNGEWITLNAEGNYEVVQKLTPAEIEAKRTQRSPRRAQQQLQTAYPLNIAPHGLIILIYYQDNLFRYDKASFERLINSDNYHREYKYTSGGKETWIIADGSAKQYFTDQSNGKYQPVFDIAGPYQVSNEMKYYGENDYNGYDLRPEEMIIEACQAADKDGVDFTLYDSNNDGKIDFVYVIYAGFGENDGGDANTIWPHSYTLSEHFYAPKSAGGLGKDTVRIDGKVLDSYACGNEINYKSNQLNGIGTFCHEFGHVLGFPDIYQTITGTTAKTSGNWDVMDYGIYNNDGNTPPAYSGYERFFLGWITPTLLHEAANVTLPELQESNACGLITATGSHNLIGNDPDPTTFYLVENRQKTGWDKFLPGHGMMLTKIQYSYSRWLANTVNNSASALGIDIIEADGQTPIRGIGSNGKAGDLFPAGATEYTGIQGHTITNITETDSTIYFKLNGGGKETILDVPFVTQECEIEGLYDMMGRAVGKDCDILPDGIYILRTKDNHTSKILINR